MRLLSIILAAVICTESVALAGLQKHPPPGLNKVRVGRDVKIRLFDGGTLSGRVVSFNGCDLEIDSEVSPVDCAQISSVEVVRPRRTQRPPTLASGLTPLGKGLVTVAVAAGIIITLGLIAAHNTK